MPWPTCPAAVPAVLSLIGSLVLRVSGRLSRLLYGSFLHGSRPRAGAEARWRPVFGPEKEIHGKSGHADTAHAAGDVPGSSATGSPYFWWRERYWKLLAPPPSSACSTAPVQEPGLAPARRPDRPAGLQRRLCHPRACAGDDRRSLHAQRRLGHLPLEARTAGPSQVSQDLLGGIVCNLSMLA